MRASSSLSNWVYVDIFPSTPRGFPAYNCFFRSVRGLVLLPTCHGPIFLCHVASAWCDTHHFRHRAFPALQLVSQPRMDSPIDGVSTNQDQIQDVMWRKTSNPAFPPHITRSNAAREGSSILDPPDAGRSVGPQDTWLLHPVPALQLKPVLASAQIRDEAI